MSINCKEEPCKISCTREKEAGISHGYKVCTKFLVRILTALNK